MFTETSLIPWIGKTGKMLGATICKIFKEQHINLTREQFIVLKILGDNNGKPQQDLAFITESDKTSLSRLMANMEKKQLITRKSVKTDKRIKKVFITEHGTEILISTIPIVNNAIKEFQEGISVEEIQAAIKTIKKIQLNINKEHSFKL